MRLSDCLTEEIAKDIVEKCLKRIIDADFKGYDPADLLNTQLLLLKKLPSPVLRGLTILNFYSPINLRGILRVSPQENTTGMVVLGLSLLRLYKLYSIPDHLATAIVIFEWLQGHAIEEQGTLGFSRIIEFHHQRNDVHRSTSTLTFINCHVAEFFLGLFEVTKKQEYREFADRVGKHILLHTKRIETKDGVCLSYVNDGSYEVPNASILAGKLLNRFSNVFDNADYKKLSLDIMDYTLAKQNPDGSWYYSFPKGKKPKRQYDFHQCYMLDGIKSYNYLPEEIAKRRDRAFELGLDFYINRMFDKKMRPYWRYPIKYPIDIHNVSHAIHFFSRYLIGKRNCLQKFNYLMNLFISEFYDANEGYFYYQRYLGFTVKHDFMRWNTVWSIYAITEYLLKLNEISS